jgi:hypothetical protein
LKTKPVWQFNVAGNNTTYLVLHINPLSADLNHICHFLALLGTHHILHVSKIRVKCPNSTKPGMSRHIFTELINIKFHLNFLSGNRASIYGEVDGRTEERIEENNESNKGFLPSCRKENHGFSNP